MTRGLYLAGASIGALLFASVLALPACAAEAADTTTPTTLGEIIVTAERRSENIQDVPASVTAITGSQLQAKGVTNTFDLTQNVPGLTFARSTAVAQPTLRGIGTRSGSTGVESNIAIYVDGVYQAHPFANVFDLTDIQQLEVLKGPQGTLYGRNAAGGAIVVTTRGPSSTPTGTVTAQYGSDNLIHGDLFVAGPLMDKLSGSLAVSDEKQDGYIHNVFLNKDEGEHKASSVRAKLRYDATDRLQLGVTVYANKTNDNAILAFHALNGNTIARTLPNPNNLPIDIRVPQGTYQTALYTSPIQRRFSGGINLNAKWETDLGTLDTVASYDRSGGDTAYDTAATVRLVTPVYGIHIYSHTYWVESNFTSVQMGKFHWSAGANFLSDLSMTRPQQTSVPVITSTYGVDSPWAASVYVQGTYNVTDQLFVTAGGRYSDERKDAFFHRLSPAPEQYAGSAVRFQSFSPSASIRYQPTSHLNLYASYSRGFKSGVFDATTTIGATTPANPETIDAFEAGVKATLMDNLRVDLAAYHYNYHNLQVQTVIAVGASTATITNNAAQAKINGLEANFDYQPVRSLTLTANFSLLHAKFSSYPGAVVIVQKPLVNGLGVGNTTTPGVDLAGYDLVRAPRATANFGVDHVLDVPGGKLETTGSLFFSAKYYGDVNNRTYQPHYTTLNGTIAYHRDDGLTFSLTGRNLTDAKVALGIYTSANADLIDYDRPREVIAGVSYSF